MEDDAGKSLHEGFPDSDRWSYLDFNRCGVPLIEIVSEPDLRTSAEAYAYLNTLKQILEYTEVSDCNMEEGSLRCDANVSVRLRGAPKFGTKVEVKNLNSFRYLAKALEFEIERQVGAPGIRRENHARNTVVERGRRAHRANAFKGIRARLPLFSRSRFAAGCGVGTHCRGSAALDAGIAGCETVAVHGRLWLDALRCRRAYGQPGAGGLFRGGGREAGAVPKTAANWIAIELLRRLNDLGKNITDCPVPPDALADLQKQVEGGKIPAASGKKVFAAMFETGRSAAVIIAAEGLAQISDASAVERIARAVVAKSLDNVAKYRSGNEGVFKFFVGQVMRETRGQANPQLVNEVLKRVLSEK